jgi:hypothetical protein
VKTSLGCASKFAVMNVIIYYHLELNELKNCYIVIKMPTAVYAVQIINGIEKFSEYNIKIHRAVVVQSV